MIIYRHRFSGFVMNPAETVEERARHVDCCRRAMQCALTIIADHVHISQRGMMTYYGVHVIHQLAQAGRTLVAVVLNCKNPEFRPLISPSVEGLRSCVGLLRRFSGRYLCGLRSADIIDEFCRVCNIPVDSPRVPDSASRPSPAWLRPVRKRASVSPAPSSRLRNSAAPGTPFGQDIMSAQPDLVVGQMPGDLEAVFNTTDYFDAATLDLTGASPHKAGASLPAPVPTAPPAGPPTGISNSNSNNVFGTSLGEPSAPFDRLETLSPNENLNAALAQYAQTQTAANNGSSGMEGIMFTNGLGGDVLPSSGVDTDGSRSQGLSAAAILSLLEEGTFDYGSIFTDQAPLPDFDFGSGVVADPGT